MKNVSILGSCISRNLFNYDILKNNFSVNFYAFQVNLWDMFSDGLNIDKSIIDQIPIESFRRKNFYLDVNKKIPDAVKEAKSDHIIIDLFTVSKDCLKVTYNGKTVYVNNNVSNEIKEYFQSNPQFNIHIEQVSWQAYDENMLFTGLNNLADFIKDNFDLNNVAVIYPTYNKQYLNDDNQILSYSSDELDMIVKSEKCLKKYSDYLVSKLNINKVLNPLESRYSVHLYSEKFNLRPAPVHNPAYLENLLAYTLNNLLLNENKTYNEYEFVCQKYDYLNNLLYNTYNKFKSVDNDVITSLNNFALNILDLNKHIVIISAKHAAACKLHKFYSKSALSELKMNIGDIQSYIGIINRKDNFVYECVSDEKISYSYEFQGGFAQIISAGAHSGNISSIIINGNEYSMNRRGLNFVILDNGTYEVISNFFCDTYADEDLIISLKSSLKL